MASDAHKTTEEAPCHSKLWNFLRANGGLIVVLIISIASDIVPLSPAISICLLTANIFVHISRINL